MSRRRSGSGEVAPFRVHLLDQPENRRFFIGTFVAKGPLEAAAIACAEARLRYLACPNYILEASAGDGGITQFPLSNLLRRKRGGDLFAYQQNSLREGGPKSSTEPTK